MSGIFWSTIVFSAFGIFVAVSVYRIVTLARLPVHLRWELSPTPAGKSKNSYGGSHLEYSEYWRRRVRHSLAFQAGYMAREILLLQGVWRLNRVLWPFSMSLHTGIYLFFLVLLLVIIDAGMLLWGAPAAGRGTFEDIVSWLALAGYVLGGIGALSLVLKRVLDADFRPFSTISDYFNLILLAAVFISGAYGWFTDRVFIADLGIFVKGLVTPAGAAPPELTISLHVSLFLIFLIYLPLSGMFHFAAKFFTYHEVRWDDRPNTKGSKLEKNITENLNRPVSWSAPHVGRGKSWAEIASGEKGDGEKA